MNKAKIISLSTSSVQLPQALQKAKGEITPDRVKNIFDSSYGDLNFQYNAKPNLTGGGFHGHIMTLPAAKSMVRRLGEKAIPYLVEKMDIEEDHKLNGILLNITNTKVNDLKNSPSEILSEGDIRLRLVQKFRESSTPPITPPDSDSSRTNSDEKA
jgi:hypothetical protein